MSYRGINVLIFCQENFNGVFGHSKKCAKDKSFCWIRNQRQMTRRQVSSKEKSPRKGGIPRRHKPVVQQQGHRVQGVQAEPEELGRQK